MTAGYEVARTEPELVEPELLRLWRGNLPVIGDVRAKLRWTYHDVPEHPDRVYLLVLHDGESALGVVGSAGLAVRRFASPTGEWRVALGCDLAVERPHRSLAPAMQLVRRVQRDGGAEFDLVYNVPNEHARPLYERAGYHDLGVLTRHVRVLRSAPYLARVMRSPRAARAAARIVDGILRARLALGARRAARYRFEWIDRIDARFDELWRAASPAYAIVGRRDARWLHWRCIAPPTGGGRIAAVLDRGTGALRAYAIVRLVDGVAHIADLFGMPDALDALLALAVQAIDDAGATSVSFRYLGSARITRLLARLGFRRRPSTHHVFVHPGDALPARARAAATDVEAWHLTDFDEDT